MTRHPQPMLPRARSDSKRWRALLVCLALLAPRTSEAQFAVTDMWITDESENRRLDSDRLNEFFNRARCECGKVVTVEVAITIDRQNTDPYYVVAGQNCLDSENDIADDCNTLKQGRIADLRSNIVFNTTVRDMMGDDCTQTETPSTLTVYAGQARELQAVGEPLEYTADGEPPDPPLRTEAPSAGEESVDVTFDAGDPAVQDIRYQLLCATVANGQLVPWSDSVRFSQYFVSKTAACEGNTEVDGGSDSTTTSAIDAGVDAAIDAAAPALDSSTEDAAATDGAADAAEDATAQTSTDAVEVPDDATDEDPLLEDPRYVCSAESSGTSIRVTRLENGIVYQFYVVAIDPRRNATNPVLLGEATPIATEDLWERYRRAGGEADGSYCALPDARAAPTSATLLLVVLLGSRWQRRCRARRTRGSR